MSAAVPAVVVAAAFLLGSVPFGVLLLRIVGGPDPRTVGSGNIGATNVARAGGRALGALTLLLDAAKGAAPVLVAQRALSEPSDLVPALAGLAAVAGHCFPPWLRLAGGKGVATFLGAFGALVGPIGVAAFAAAFAALTVPTRIVALGSVAGAWAVAALAAGSSAPAPAVTVAAAALLVTARHRSNFARLRAAAAAPAAAEAEGAALGERR